MSQFLYPITGSLTALFSMAVSLEKSQREAYLNVLAAGTSIVVGVSSLNWLDCLRVRWQVTQSSHPGLVHYFRHVVCTEGLWRDVARTVANVVVWSQVCGEDCGRRAFAPPIATRA